MDNNKNKKTYGRVMPRVYNTVGHKSRQNLKDNSNVTRHQTSSSLQLGAKASSSNLVSGSFRELPIVLHDYQPDTPNKPKKLRYVAKPKKTLQSLDTVNSPILTKKLRQVKYKVPKINVHDSAPSIVKPDASVWSESHFRECHSSRSHTRLKDIKDEIEAFEENQKKTQFRNNLYQKCGVVLDDEGLVAADKAVQVEQPDDTLRDIRASHRWENSKLRNVWSRMKEVLMKKKLEDQVLSQSQTR